MTKSKLSSSKEGIRLLPSDGFSPSDKEWIKANRISPGKYIDHGAFGAVYKVKNNSNLVVKIPVEAAQCNCHLYKGECYPRKELIKEAKNCKVLGDSFAIPTKLVKMNKCGIAGGHCVGLVRPMVSELRPRFTSWGRPIEINVSEEALESLRQKLIRLSEKGYTLDDGFQVGFDRKNRLLLYDQGCIQKYSYQFSSLLKRNNNTWFYFLHTVFNYPGFPHEYTDELAGKYGRIEVNSKRS